MTTLLDKIVNEVTNENYSVYSRRKNRQKEMLDLCIEIESALHKLGFESAKADRSPSDTGRRDVTFTICHPEHDQFVVGVYESDGKPTPDIRVLPPYDRKWFPILDISDLESAIAPLIKEHLSNGYTFSRIVRDRASK